jgi:hypothetical protein
MLQWNTRLLAVLILAVAVASVFGEFGGWGGFQFGW